MKVLRESSPRVRRHFTRFDQVDQLVRASEAAPDTGFMARLMMLCSLPRTNPGTQLQYKRVNRTLHSDHDRRGSNRAALRQSLPPVARLVCTEAVRTQSRELFLGASLSGFMRKLDMAPQPDEAALQRAYQLAYEDRQVSASVNSPVPAGPGSGGTSASPASGWSGRAKSNSARSSSTRSSAILCRWI